MNQTNGTTVPNNTGTNTDPADSATTSNNTHGPNTSTPQPTTFMGSPIDMFGNVRHPILTPHQFQLPGQPVMEVIVHKFQKAKLNLKCSGIDTIFTLYQNLRHVAQSFNILLMPLE